MPDRNICVKCGLCCDGTIFTQARLNYEDAPTACKAKGIELIEVGGNDSIYLPCSRLTNKTCSIYRDRPSVCKNYKCKLLTAYETGQTTYENAISLIISVTNLRDKLRAQIQQPPTLSITDIGYLRLKNHYAAEIDSQKLSLSDLDAEILLNIGTMKALISKYFRNLDIKATDIK